MLLVVIAALYLAARRPIAAALLMAVAATMKLSPVYYARHMLFGNWPKWTIAAWFVVVGAGLVLPYLVPVALFLAFKTNSARHLLLPLLIPDKRGTRNVAAAVGLAIDALGVGTVSLNDTLPVMTVILAVGLWRSRKTAT